MSHAAGVPSQQQSRPWQPPPPTFTATPVSIEQESDELLQQVRDTRKHLIQEGPPTSTSLNKFILTLAQADNAVLSHHRLCSCYEDLSPNEDVRNAASEAVKKLDAFDVDSESQGGIFVLIEAVIGKAKQLDPESQRLLMNFHRNGLRNGFGLAPGASRHRLKAIRDRIRNAEGEFSKTMAECYKSGGTWFTVEDLDGVPESTIAGLKRGDGEQDGKVLLKMPGAAIRNAKSGETRSRAEVDWYNRFKDNADIFKEVVVLRDEAARLLGYPNHAALRIEEKMAQDPKVVDSLLESLTSQLLPIGRQEIEQLKRLKRADVESRGEVFDGHFFMWDLYYYRSRLKQQEFSIDPDKVSEYFALDATLDRMLGIFSLLFGMSFVEAQEADKDRLASSGNGEELVWHGDVRMFMAWSEGGSAQREFLGYLYLDLFERDGKTRSCSTANIVPGFLKRNGERQYPATALIWNYAKPQQGFPKLVTHAQLWNLFHELGHGIHDLVSKTQYARFHGPSGTSVDFGEAPSQMLENWLWIPAQIKALGRHYSYASAEWYDAWQATANGEPQPPEEMPDEMIDAVVRGRHVGAATNYLLRLAVSKFDMAIHQPQSHQCVLDMNMSKIYNQMLQETYPLEGPLGQGDEWSHGQTTLDSVITSDYDAGLYSYVFSKVYADDIYYAFFRQDPTNVDEGLRYRRMVLEKGGGQSEMETMTAYLGREVSMDGFCAALGMNAS